MVPDRLFVRPLGAGAARALPGLAGRTGKLCPSHLFADIASAFNIRDCPTAQIFPEQALAGQIDRVIVHAYFRTPFWLQPSLDDFIDDFI